MTLSKRQRFDQIVVPQLEDGYRLARWLTGSATDAEDVVQDACLRAYTAIERFTDVNARAWFLTIVRNSCHSWLRKRKPHLFLSLQDVGDSEADQAYAAAATDSARLTPEDELIAKDESARISRAIDEIPFYLRETLVLREYNGLNYREIAAVTDVPIGTVMSRLARARQLLGLRLNGEGRA